jgi:hypothetical protein
MVSVPAHMYAPSLKKRVQHIASIVMLTQSLKDHAELVRLSTEPHTCSGLLRILRFSLPGLMTVPMTHQMLLLVRRCDAQHRGPVRSMCE